MAIEHGEESAGSSSSGGGVSFGNLLLQLQEEQLKVVDLDNKTTTTTTTTTSQEEEKKKPPSKPSTTTATTSTAVSTEDDAEVDETVKPVYNLRATNSWDVLPLSDLYQTMMGTAEKEPTFTTTNSTTTTTTTTTTALLERDLQRLALHICHSLQDATEWRLFCRNGGGLLPLLTATDASCRAVRDLCALGPELAAVVTDDFLRVNQARSGQLMRDLRDLLRGEKGTKQEGGRSREMRWRCRLYVCQLLLAMATASDDAIDAMRACDGLNEAILACSSYARKERTRRWIRYPGEIAKWLWRRKRGQTTRRPFLEAANVANDITGNVQRTANQVLAALGYNQWIPKVPGQRGLRVLALDGGGSRGMVAVTAVQQLMEKIGNGAEVADSFDVVAGTSTGGIIAFLTGLRRETSAQAVERYNQLISQIFVKSALSTPLMFFTTATYDETNFMDILSKILQDEIMLDSRADPGVPLVFCVTSKMSSTPTHVALLRNYNYAKGELPDTFTIDPDRAREDLDLPLEMEHPIIRNSNYEKKRSQTQTSSPGVRKSTEGSRHPGSFRVLQRFALRASTAAPTVFKPVRMGGEIFADGGIVTSNPCAVAIHEARSLFPDIPIELVVSVGTGGFVEQKSAPRIGWDGIIGQIVNSATDGEQIHHILEDILGDPTAVIGGKKTPGATRYFRLNPVLGLPDEFPIDVTDPEKLELMKKITRDYMNAPEQEGKLEEIADILKGQRWSKGVRSLFRRQRSREHQV